MHYILCIGPGTSQLTLRNRALVTHGYTVHAATFRGEALHSVRTGQFDVALIDDILDLALESSGREAA